MLAPDRPASASLVNRDPTNDGRGEAKDYCDHVLG